MDRFITIFILSLIAYIVVRIIIALLNARRRRQIRAGTPDRQQLETILPVLQQMAANGASFQDKMAYLRRQGVDSRVAEVLLAKLEEENAKASAAQPAGVGASGAPGS